MDLLAPGTDLHKYMLNKLVRMLDSSEDKMRTFYNRWGVAEKRSQAYINASDYENLLKEINERKGPATITSITIPYSFATIQTIITYLIHVFGGRKPMFSVGTYKGDQMAARMMEHALQYNSDHTRLVKELFQYFSDGELYGLGILKTQWKREEKMRTVWVSSQPTIMGVPIPWGQPQRQRTRQKRVTFEGTDVTSIDPFAFFPDPRVPIQLVARKGAFVFWRTYENKNGLKSAEQRGELRYVDSIPKGQQSGYASQQSYRGHLSRGDSTAGQRDNASGRTMIDDNIQIDQGSVEIVPAECGLGTSTELQKWIFTIGNKGQILQAQPLDADHDQHPVCVIEPYTMGYGFGQPGVSDYLGPVQDTISWFLNSHIHNVRSALNNMFLVDPSMIEMQDLKNPEPGKIIRLKRAAHGQDVRTALSQLNVQDITRSHVNDLDMFVKLGDSLSAVNDNLRGVQDAGGRKTATEVRQSGEMGASRLAAHAKLISSQGIMDLSEQMCLNMQQNLTEEFFVNVVGEKGAAALLKILPEMLVGDFHFPINDGTLPMDRVAMLDVWKEVYLGIAQDPQMRQQFNMVGLFEFLAELGGAQNIDRFRLDVAPNEMAAQQVQAGNGIPLQEAMAGLGAAQ